MRHFNILIIMLCTTVFLSCGTSLKLWNGGDLQAPHLLKIEVLDNTTLSVSFDEAIDITSLEVLEKSSNKFEVIEHTDFSITLHSPFTLVAGQMYDISIFVTDTVGNSLLKVESIFGFNDRIPSLVINEFTCEGSKTKPDRVELFVLESGNLAGLALQEGGVYTYKQRVVFPNIEVKKGEYIVIHWDPEPKDNIESEIASKTASTHSQAVNTAWDIFSTQGKGISNTNSSLTLLNLANMKVLDAVVYSTKDDDLQHINKGFGYASNFSWVNEIYKLGEWDVADANIGILPSDAIYPKDSTSTRSISRDSKSTDSNSRKDWHITPTGKSSFGLENSNEVYIP